MSRCKLELDKKWHFCKENKAAAKKPRRRCKIENTQVSMWRRWKQEILWLLEHWRQQQQRQILFVWPTQFTAPTRRFKCQTVYKWRLDSNCQRKSFAFCWFQSKIQTVKRETVEQKQKEKNKAPLKRLLGKILFF